jgi:glycosyltransferase involved in cell wall biosynthesis
MIVVYHAIRPFEESRHRGLMAAYGARVPVVYVDPMNVWRSTKALKPPPGADHLPTTLDEPRVYRARLSRLLPLGRFRAISLAHRWLAMRQLLKAIRRRSRGRAVVFVAQHPEFLPTLAGLPVDLTVYEVRDDYAALTPDPAARRRVERAHQRMLDSSDLVLAVSDRLVSDIRPTRADVELTSVGVEREFFDVTDDSAAPAALRDLSRPRIGMIGNLNDRVNWDLLERLAMERPDWTLAIVGPVYSAGDTTRTAVRRLETFPNVRFLGAVGQSEIPSVIAAFDVCLIPYRISEAVERINPLKLYQYLAAGKPIVSTAIPIVEKFKDVVAWCRSDDEFLRAVHLAVVQESDPSRREARRAAAIPYTWDAIVAHQINSFRRALERRGRSR